MKARKICMIGDFGVGKTSLVSRFVNQVFDERYLTTVGVKIDTRELTLASGDRVKLVLWDLAGKTVLADIDARYLRDAAGYLLVADGTRRDTLDNALRLQSRTEEIVGRVPFTLLLNKVDLDGQWQLDRDRIDALRNRDWALTETSALTGDGVERAFQQLGERLSATP